MKNTFLCIVIFISCSGCAIGDLEFYPDYQRSDFSEEDLVKDGSVNPELQNFLDEQRSSIYQPIRPRLSYLDLYKNKQEDLTWPNTAAHNIFKNEDLARRLTQLSRNLEETNRRPQYYFKTHGLNREQENRYNLYNNIEDQNNGEFIPRFKPNFRILDDIRLNPDEDNSDFSLPSSEIADFPNDRNEDQRNTFSPEIEPVTDKLKPEYLETQTSTDDNPSEFAYPPSDPRFFEDTAPNEVKISSDGDNEEDGRRDNRDSIQLQNRNEYYQQPLADLKDYRSGFDDGGDVVAIKPHSNDDTTGVYIIAIVAGISAAATVGLIAFGIGWYNLQKHVKSASDVEYPAYGVTGPNKDISPSGDRRLAQSAQMYHYQHQKQQIIAMESRAAANERHGSVSEADSDEENEEGDYTVYECPGLAPTGEMEVKNPLFQDDPTPAQTPALKDEDGHKK